MKTAKELLLNYLELINDADKLIELFDEDAIVELPYLASLNLPWQWKGKDSLHQFFKELPVIFSGFEFKNIQIHIDTPSQAFGEYSVEAMVNSTGRAYHQTYMGRLVAANGKIKHIREGQNMIVVAESMFPNGFADLVK